jgi:hypothetical protein
VLPTARIRARTRKVLPRAGAIAAVLTLVATNAAVAAPTDLTNYGSSEVEVPTSRVYAFSATCAAVPCTIRLTKRALAGGRNVRGLDPTTGPPIQMTESPAPLTEEHLAEGDEPSVFGVWFSPADLRRRLLLSTLSRYGSVRLQVHGTITDATGATATA